MACNVDFTLYPSVIEGVTGKMIDVRRPGTWAAVVNSGAIDVAMNLIGVNQFFAGFADHHRSGLMAWVAIELRNVVIPDNVASLKSNIAFSSVSDIVATGIEDTVSPTSAPPDATFNDSGMNVPLGMTGANGGKNI